MAPGQCTSGIHLLNSLPPPDVGAPALVLSGNQQ
jgi:hypothetical protein